MQLIKAQSSFDKESSVEKERERRSTSRSKEEEKPTRQKEERSSVKEDVNFLMQVKFHSFIIVVKKYDQTCYLNCFNILRSSSLVTSHKTDKNY